MSLFSFQYRKNGRRCPEEISDAWHACLIDDASMLGYSRQKRTREFTCDGASPYPHVVGETAGQLMQNIFLDLNSVLDTNIISTSSCLSRACNEPVQAKMCGRASLMLIPGVPQKFPHAYGFEVDSYRGCHMNLASET
jgi:hypothetical protein